MYINTVIACSWTNESLWNPSSQLFELSFLADRILKRVEIENGQCH